MLFGCEYAQRFDAIRHWQYANTARHYPGVVSTFTSFTKRLLVGRPFRTDRLQQTLLPKRLALPVFSADALSSIAYAPQEILLTLAAAGALGYSVSWQVGVLVAVVMAIVLWAYRQNVREYPSGGGDYEVANTNLGTTAGLLVAAALMVDYVLTVAVSVSAAAQYASSAIPALRDIEALVGVVAVMALAFANLRGSRESSRALALPTYAFLACVVVVGVVGAVRYFSESLPLAESARYEMVPTSPGASETLLTMGGAFLVARAFSSGCAALTGVEAISNGVPSFKQPKAKNAATTLALLGVISIAMFTGVLMLARVTGVKYVNEAAPWEALTLGGELGVESRGDTVTFSDGTVYHQSPVLIQVTDAVFGGWVPAVIAVTAVVGMILLVAANSSFAGFPILASVLARDGFLPRQLRSRGDRLVFSNGIVMLALAASALILAFNAHVTHLVQLYIVGVFVSFTLGQLGMVLHWNRALNLVRDKRERRRMVTARAINTLGLVCTGTVLLVVSVTKFVHGAWITFLAMALLIAWMRAIKSHYNRVSKELTVSKDDDVRLLPSRVTAIVLISQLHRPAMRAISYARASRPNSLEAVAVGVDAEEISALRASWDEHNVPIPLKVLDSPYREMTRPVVDYVKTIRRSSPRELVVVYLPEYVVGNWWETVLHNQSALRLKAQLRFTRGVIVASVPWQLASSHGLEQRLYEPGAEVAEPLDRDN